MASTEERLAHLEEQVQGQSQGFSEVRDSIRHLEHRFDMRFQGLDQRFDSFEQRVDTRVVNLEQRFQHLEQRVDARFDTLDHRFNLMFGAQMGTLVAIIGGFLGVIASLLSR